MQAYCVIFFMVTGKETAIVVYSAKSPQEAVEYARKKVEEDFVDLVCYELGKLVQEPVYDGPMNYPN